MEMEKITKTEEEWRAQLGDLEYRVTRQAATERPFTGDNFPKGPGKFMCTCCGAELFDADTKFDSGSGWPSFYQPVNDTIVGENTDTTHGMVRTEVRCNRCDAHLGHVFPDGPNPTGQRYCINGAALKFESGEE